MQSRIRLMNVPSVRKTEITSPTFPDKSLQKVHCKARPLHTCPSATPGGVGGLHSLLAQRGGGRQQQAAAALCGARAVERGRHRLRVRVVARLQLPQRRLQHLVDLQQPDPQSSQEGCRDVLFHPCMHMAGAVVPQPSKKGTTSLLFCDRRIGAYSLQARAYLTTSRV